MVLLALAPACGFKSSSAVPIDAPLPDAPPPPDAALCYGSIVHLCFDSPSVIPTTPKNLMEDTDIDTDSMDPAICNQANSVKGSYCVFAGAGFSLMMGRKITAHGGKPLVLLSTQMMTLDGDVDVSSHHMGPQPKGPGADPTAVGACTILVAATMNAGAAGGSFGTRGGFGSDAVPTSGLQGQPGSAIAEFPVPLRGGCPGGDSAVGGAGSEGHGGDGGGAIAILGAPIQINGKIDASGGGGHGGAAGLVGVQGGGGGGGGTGGMIVLDSPMALSLGARARIWANGGGGAQGGAPLTGGNNGNESTDPGTAAPASNGSPNGGNGGAGSLGSNGGAAGVGDAVTGGGGGGGGGGAGIIHAPGVTDSAVVSPPTINP
jgi:hypothetical protein